MFLLSWTLTLQSQLCLEEEETGPNENKHEKAGRLNQVHAEKIHSRSNTIVKALHVSTGKVQKIWGEKSQPFVLINTKKKKGHRKTSATKDLFNYVSIYTKSFVSLIYAHIKDKLKDKE